MFKNSKLTASFSVNDLDLTKDFYQKLLGLSIKNEFDGGFEIQNEDGDRVMIYVKENHVPATYTVLNIEVKDIVESVKELNNKGIEMQQYPEMGTDESGISRSEYGNMAWFKDPAGNIIAMMEGF